MNNRKRKLIIVFLFLLVITIVFATSYALFTYNVTKDTDFKVAVGNLELTITDTETKDQFIISDMVPTKDKDALTKDGYTFTIKNKGTIDSYYTVYLDDSIMENGKERLSSDYVKVNLYNHSTDFNSTNYLNYYGSNDRVLTSGILEANGEITYTLKMWLDYDAGNDAQNKYFATQIRIVGTQTNTVSE